MNNLAFFYALYDIDGKKVPPELVTKIGDVFESILEEDFNTADITIGSHSMDHGDGNPFDGQGGTLAHAFAPTNGRFHYDADENWATEPITGYYDLYTIALHEIGHLLGLHHSSVEGAIMYPSIASGVRKELHGDDVQGIRALYNL
ncbi:Metalloendoproteinase [Thalictrum thalictroides]|uniref:Metalloendoproteinase n=1 Tax=Thalictrum thalictroides TaxID=46969 RepID=A0A7J6WJB9_THATH|nr:Metalloendoproteinase [Thalictrum thalictroides]